MGYHHNIVNTFLNTPGCNVCIIDANYCVTEYSKSFARIIKRYSNVDIKIGMNFLDTALNNELKNKLNSDLDYVVKNKHFNEFETDDDYILNKSYSLIEDNNKHLGILILFNVIQDTYNINYKNHYELMIFKNIANSIPIGITLIDHTNDDFPILFVNKKFEEITESKREDKIGKSCTIIKDDKTNPKGSRTIKKTIKNRLSCKVEIKHFTKSGKPIYKLIDVSPLLDSDGNI
ncbi:MAG: PAS domain-containing protein [Campylobacterota bacterium]|nr:PAS domain-containing protein [Campylobacterota bacterium]